MNNWKVIFATAVIFGAGVLTGGLLVNYVQRGTPKVVRPRPAEPRAGGTNAAANPADVSKLRPPEILSKPFLQRLDEELHLSQEQHQAAQKIINEGQNQIRKTIQDARLEIRDVLTPEQQKQFDELVKRPFHKPIFATNGPAAPASVPVTSTNAP